jgi:hypothetical protein
MTGSDNATHKHRRLGEVVVLQSTTELAQVLTLDTRERMWVKQIDLSVLTEKVVPVRAGRKRRSA